MIAHQLTLFDMDRLDITPTLYKIRQLVDDNDYRPFPIDTLEKLGKMHHILCGVIINQYWKEVSYLAGGIE